MNKQVAFGPESGTPLSWESPGGATHQDLPAGDPRLDLSSTALDEASRNAFAVVATQRSRKDGLGLLAGLGVALVLGLATFVSLSSERDDPKLEPIVEAPATTAEVTPSDTSQLVVGTQTPMEHTLKSNGEASPHVMASTLTQSSNFTQMSGTSPVVVFDGSTGSASSNLSQATHGGHVRSQDSNMLSSAVEPSGGDVGTSSTRSRRMEDPSMTVVQGSLIPAVLETAINSDVPGYARAVVSQDVRSFDGKRVLIPRSSRLIGEYKAAPSSGQRRVHLIWTRLVRPDGVSVQLASPATDISGRAGIGGKVNSHFFERLGSALLTSVIGSVSPFGRGASTVVVAGGESAASTAVQGLGQRPPTIRVQQGEPVRVFAARDLVFSATDGSAE